jgi:DNA-binding SARP family transcriptional activator
MSYFQSMSFTLRLFGSPAIQLEHGSWQDIASTKPALLLLYLAFAEDWVSRESLATLLQPDGDDGSVRRYLRVLLNRAKDFAWAGSLEIETERLRFAVDTDVQQFLKAIAAEQWSIAYELHKKSLLENFVIRDAPALEAWLELERERLLRAWNLSALRHAQNLAENQNHLEAMRVLEQLLVHDPLQEDVVVAFMRQCARTGSKPDAIRAFERFKTALETELGLEPMPETLVLLEQIRRSQVVVVAAATKSQPIAKALLRPPRLIGRESEITAFQNSSAKINLFLAEAGAGKTRLLEEIAPAQARWWHCREGLEGIPYQPITQWLRSNLSAIPELGAYREDLARLAPETAPNEIFGPGEPSSAKARLLEALARVFEASESPIVIDDLQWMDSSSLETLTMLAARGRVPIVAAVRSDEINRALEETLNIWRGQGVIQEIKLEPLSATSLQALIEEVTERNAIGQDIRQWLSEHGGGNAFFVLETLRDLIEHGTVIDPSDLRIPNQVQHLIERRFKRLSQTTQRILQAASVMREGFTPQHLSGMIGISEFAALDALEETERAGFIIGNRFQHDLVRQSMYKSIQDTRRKALHARAATLLAETAEAIIVAEHWSNADTNDKAIEYWLIAANQFKEKFLPLNAEQCYLLAAKATNNAEKRQGFLLSAFESVADTRLDNRYDLIIQEVLEKPAGPNQYWMAKICTIYNYLNTSQLDNAQVAIEEIHAAFPDYQLPDQELTLYFLGLVQNYFFQRGNYEQALKIVQELIINHVNNPPMLCSFKNTLGSLLSGLKRYDEAKTTFQEAILLAKQVNSTSKHLIIATNWVFLHLVQHNTDTEINLGNSIEYAEVALHRDPTNSFVATDVLRNNLAAIYQRVNRVEEAIKQLEFNCSNASSLWRGAAWAKLSKIYAERKQFPQVAQALDNVIGIAESLDDAAMQATAIVAALTYGNVEAVTRAKKAARYGNEALAGHPYLITQLDEAEKVWAKRQLELNS